MARETTIAIDADLRDRLATLAAREGVAVDDLTERVLRAHLDHAEREAADAAEDARRWQRYLETGAAVPFPVVRDKLRRLAAQAAERGTSQ